MEQPIPTVAPYAEAAELLGALGVERSELPVELYDNGLPQRLRRARRPRRRWRRSGPTSRRLSELPASDRRQLLRRRRATAGRRGCSRRARGVAEDPATGSAAGPLALHLARHGRIAFGDEIEITQGVEISRPSKLFARVDGSAEHVERVEVGGSAVVVARGEFQL